MIYSDGVTEARNPAGEMFGVKQLEEFIGSNAHVDAGPFVEAIRSTVISFANSG